MNSDKLQWPEYADAPATEPGCAFADEPELDSGCRCGAQWRCETCRHAQPWPGRQDEGLECSRILSGITVPGVGAPDVEPDFGCVLWEERT